MDLGIKNKVALVAAASQGLGKAVARQLSREGAIVAICARNREKLNSAQEEIAQETGGIVRVYVADVTQKKQVQNMVEAIVAEFGTIEILICNAGGPPSGLVDDFSPDDYKAAVELNLISTLNLCYQVMPLMKKQKWGRIINIVSVSAKQPIDSLILSNTARAGVLGFSKSLSNQLAPLGITVNSVCPGYTKTERVENLAESFAQAGKGTTEDFYKAVEKSIPLGRLGKPEEFAQAVAFLASEGAGYITGTALQIDGGFIKGVF
jgi:3-oxoacyl-[acyl-carrier protein] reductase